jgi:hypothetical protein
MGSTVVSSFWSILLLMFKKVLMALAAGFLTFRTYELMHLLTAVEPTTWSSVANAGWGAMLNLFATGIWAFPGFVWPTHKLLPQAYYHIHHPQALRASYTWLGVPHFQKALLWFFWGKPQHRKRYFNGTRSGLAAFEYHTKQSEFGHLGALILLLVCAIQLMAHGAWALAGWTMAINVVLNLYPLILQRYHRLNLARLNQRNKLKPAQP